MKKKNNLFICIFNAIIIVLFIYVVPLKFVISYSNMHSNMYTDVYTSNDMFSNAYNKLTESEYKNYAIMIRKTTEHNISTLQSGYPVLFTYYTVCVGLLLLVTGICLKKHNANVSKVCVITSILLFICAILYMVI